MNGEEAREFHFFPAPVPAPVPAPSGPGAPAPQGSSSSEDQRVVSCMLAKLIYSAPHVGTVFERLGLKFETTFYPGPFTTGAIVIMSVSLTKDEANRLVQEHQDLYKQCLCELYGKCEGVRGGEPE